MNSTLGCDKTKLNNGALLYWQHTCDSIWLTLETEDGIKKTINELDVELYGYRYRLGFYLVKEFQNELLFRSGCPANGPCFYTLIDKNNGDIIKEFHQLIMATEDDYNFNFLVYLSYDSEHICVYSIKNRVTIKTDFSDTLTGIIPEYQFEEMKMNKDKLELTYTQNETKKSILVNIKP